MSKPYVSIYFQDPDEMIAYLKLMDQELVLFYDHDRGGGVTVTAEIAGEAVLEHRTGHGKWKEFRDSVRSENIHFFGGKVEPIL